jgi:hypothetical protein
LHQLKCKDSAGCLAVVEEAQFIDFQVVDGKAMGILCMKGEAHFIDRDA